MSSPLGVWVSGLGGSRERPAGFEGWYLPTGDLAAWVGYRVSSKSNSLMSARVYRGFFAGSLFLSGWRAAAMLLGTTSEAVSSHQAVDAAGWTHETQATSWVVKTQSGL